MKIVNCTPHPVNICDEGGNVRRVIPPSGDVIRLAARTERCGNWDGVPLSRTVFGEPEGFPARDADTLYIVSALVKAAMPEDASLVVPAEVVRDEQGRVVGCRSLGK